MILGYHLGHDVAILKSSGSRLTNLYRDASSALLRSHAFYYGSQNKKTDLPAKYRSHDSSSTVIQ